MVLHQHECSIVLDSDFFPPEMNLRGQAELHAIVLYHIADYRVLTR